MPFIIDIDHDADQGAKPGTNANAAGVIGPRSYRGDGKELTCAFRMLTDDRDLVYEGRSDDDSSFEPLDCFGMPNYGCTIIQYRVPSTSSRRGEWRDL